MFSVQCLNMLGDAVVRPMVRIQDFEQSLLDPQWKALSVHPAVNGDLVNRNGEGSVTTLALTIWLQ